ncbi:MAG: hypothetical protein ABIS29_10490 [Vicinamibacterales bacterium]
MARCAEALAMVGRSKTRTAGVLLGNFPQPYPRVGLNNTAVTISELLEARDARFRAWS